MPDTRPPEGHLFAQRMHRPSSRLESGKVGRCRSFHPPGDSNVRQRSLFGSSAGSETSSADNSTATRLSGSWSTRLGDLGPLDLFAPLAPPDDEHFSDSAPVGR